MPRDRALARFFANRRKLDICAIDAIITSFRVYRHYVSDTNPKGRVDETSYTVGAHMRGMHDVGGMSCWYPLSIKRFNREKAG